MKYYVVLPESSKRMVSHKLVIKTHGVWSNSSQQTYLLSSPIVTIGGTNRFTFEVADDIPWCGSPSVMGLMDADTFSVQAIYTNATDSRKEVHDLTPVRIDDNC